MLSFRKSSRVIIVAAVVLVTVLLAGFTMSKVYNKDNSDENKLLTNLGYTKKLVSDVIDNRTSFGVNDEQMYISSYKYSISTSVSPFAGAVGPAACRSFFVRASNTRSDSHW